MGPFDPTGKTLKIEFASKEIAKHFKLWLCEQGEQDYWNWMEIREQEETGDITALRFGYHNGNTINTWGGRLDKEEEEENA